MKPYANVMILASMAYILSALDIPSDILLFLKNIKAPPSCNINEVFTTCKSPCPDCIHRGMCTIDYCESACDCAPRFYRKTPDGPCEPVANCPIPECGENEVFRECGPMCEKCTTMKCRLISCDYKCYCKEGYRRNTEGKCIPANDCPKRLHCTRREKWAERGPANEFCPQELDTTNEDEIRNETQCYCIEGHKRNFLGHCANETLCPLARCMGVEVYHNCIPKCNTTCRNYGNPNCIEDDNCYPGCFCPPGHVMNDLRSCVPVANCSLGIQQVKITGTSDEKEDETTIEFQTQDEEEIRGTTENPYSNKTTENYFKTTETVSTTDIPSTTTELEVTETTVCPTVPPAENGNDSKDKSTLEDDILNAMI